MNQPLVSIIMPVYNCEKYLAEAIESILSQTYTSIELICIDDGSTDNSHSILATYLPRITIISNETNGGIAARRNQGIRSAHGEYIAFADADDIWMPNKLELQIKELEANPTLDIAFCMIENFISPDIPENIKQSRSFPKGSLPGHISGAFVAKKTSFDKVGLLDEHYRVGEFIEWMTRAKECNLSQMMIPEVLYMRRVHETNTTLNKQSQNDYIKIAKAALDRRRAQQS